MGVMGRNLIRRRSEVVIWTLVRIYAFQSSRTKVGENNENGVDKKMGLGENMSRSRPEE